MSSKQKVKQTSITEDESEILIDKMDRDELSADDKKIIAKVLRSYIYLALMVQQAGIKLKTIRDFLFGPKTTKKKVNNKETVDEKNSHEGDSEPGEESESADKNCPLTTPPSAVTRKRKKPNNKANTGHGRLPAEAYTGAEHQTCQHDKLKAGMTCPACERANLRQRKSKKIIRLHGHSTVSVICYEAETLECSLCGEIFNTPIPTEESTGKYNPSAITSIVLSKYYMGLPAYRLEQFQKMVGVPLPDSTQWDLTEQFFTIVFPIIQRLIEMSAQSSLIHYDDTRARILTLITENKILAEGARYGIHCTGFVTLGEQTIILYFTGRSHAGENINKLLSLRTEGLPKVIRMSDASSSNPPKDYDDMTIETFCNSHSTRKFKEIRKSFPDECDLILEVMVEIFDIDRKTKLEKMTPEKRRDYHAEHSGPLLGALKIWMVEQQEKYRTIEPNSLLGQAINYMLKRWDGFTRFLTIPGVPLDNNIVERALKRMIFHRKNSLFFANEFTAYVGCGLISLIMTTVEAGVNPFDYFNVLQDNSIDVVKNPEKWLPWNYQETIRAKAA